MHSSARDGRDRSAERERILRSGCRGRRRRRRGERPRCRRRLLHLKFRAESEAHTYRASAAVVPMRLPVRVLPNATSRSHTAKAVHFRRSRLNDFRLGVGAAPAAPSPRRRPPPPVSMGAAPSRGAGAGPPRAPSQPRPFRPRSALAPLAASACRLRGPPGHPWVRFPALDARPGRWSGANDVSSVGITCSSLAPRANDRPYFLYTHTLSLSHSRSLAGT